MAWFVKVGFISQRSCCIWNTEWNEIFSCIQKYLYHTCRGVEGKFICNCNTCSSNNICYFGISIPILIYCEGCMCSNDASEPRMFPLIICEVLLKLVPFRLCILAFGQSHLGPLYVYCKCSCRLWITLLASMLIGTCDALVHHSDC